MIGFFLVASGLVFSLIGLSQVNAYATDPPANAPGVVKKRFEIRKHEQWTVGPLFLAFGGLAFAIGVGSFVKWQRRL